MLVWILTHSTDHLSHLITEDDPRASCMKYDLIWNYQCSDINIYGLYWTNKERERWCEVSFFLPKMRHSASFGVLSYCLYFSLLVFTKQITFNSIFATQNLLWVQQGADLWNSADDADKENKTSLKEIQSIFLGLEKEKTAEKLENDCVNECCKRLVGKIMIYFN